MKTTQRPAPVLPKEEAFMLRRAFRTNASLTRPSIPFPLSNSTSMQKEHNAAGSSQMRPSSGVEPVSAWATPLSVHGRTTMRACRGSEQNDGAWIETTHKAWPRSAPACLNDKAARLTDAGSGPLLRPHKHQLADPACGWGSWGGHKDVVGYGSWKDPQSNLTVKGSFHKFRGDASRLLPVSSPLRRCDGLGVFPGLNLRWRPRHCTLERPSAAQFCRLLGGRRLVIVGDSILHQFSVALINFLTLHLAIERTEEEGPANCATNIFYALAGTLVHRPFGRLNAGEHWGDVVRQLKPDLLVMGVGPHVWGEAPFTAVVEEVAAEYNASFRHVPLVWMLNSGAGCGLQPLSRYPDAAFWSRHPPPLWTWMDFMRRDEIATRVWRRHPGVALLDLKPTYLRVDAHPGSWLAGQRYNQSANQPLAKVSTANLTSGRGASYTDAYDCLHSCEPGPAPDLAVQLLLHKLVHHQSALGRERGDKPRA